MELLNTAGLVVATIGGLSLVLAGVMMPLLDDAEASRLNTKEK